MHAPVTVAAGSPETSGALLGAAAGLATRQVAGLVPIERLLAAPAGSPLADLMDPEPPVVDPETDQERAAWTMIERGESSLAVADEHGRFLGLIPNACSPCCSRPTTRTSRGSAATWAARAARQAAEEPVLRRPWHRLPWLLVGLAGAMAAALIVGAFEDELEAKVVLAFFVPGVVYMADAVGTQTEALLIRGLSVGIAMRTVVRRELVTGLAEPSGRRARTAGPASASPAPSWTMPIPSHPSSAQFRRAAAGSTVLDGPTRARGGSGSRRRAAPPHTRRAAAR